MEYGLVANLDQYKDNRSVQLEQIQASSDAKLNEGTSNLNELRKEEFLKAGETSSLQKAKNESAKNSYEYVLTNMNFGFNDSSKDFYVKAQRGESESQYPTEEMMRLKAFLQSQAQQDVS
ncbi:MAG: hypothetical protein ACQERD_07805 [Campylobacterota bacterium]